ncbi:sodium/hydrogen exchanger [Candidatus Magnetoovum chiemensis]|nr:sodium/hydrogen exchanger [Candidatus Magnetoovum chiemensis]
MDNINLSLFIALMVLLSKIFPVLFSKFIKLNLTEAFSTALILSVPLSLMVAAGAIGVRLKLITKEISDSIVIAAMFCSIIYPYLFRFVVRKLLHNKQ